ncbi:DUF52 domain protein [Cordyceps militaris CM01]|uniref:DUF52 domain protein n=1 Tax=Cordyceps militaris (strain CM01) TaxID=983644 RepID=G3JNS6_CORMM|nr:DUF52 domain protein [Cordyceps militaris CM01]EGX89916.1 DUF52 domain protein [Cordyceps militaris CM01]
MPEAPLTCDEVLGRGWNDFSEDEKRSLLRAERKKMTETLDQLHEDCRPPMKAFDGWYELAPFQLRWNFDEYLDEVPETIQGSPLPIPGARAIIAPHAGYAYSGRCSAWAFRCLDLARAKRVFVLGPTHYFYFRGLALSTFASYSTPLGAFRVDQQTLRDVRAAADALGGAPDVRNMPRRRELDEHSLEMEIAFLYQRCEAVFASPADFPAIVPMLVSGDADDERAVGRLLLPYLRDPANAFVVSSDFCHWGRQFGDYRPYFRGGDRARRVNLRDADAPPSPPIHESIKMLDDEAIAAMETGSHDAFVANLEETENSVCGRHPIGAMMAALELLGADGAPEDRPRFKHVRYDRSALLTEPTKSSVSYNSIS